MPPLTQRMIPSHIPCMIRRLVEAPNANRTAVSRPDRAERERVVGLARSSFIQGVRRFPGLPPERLRMMIAESFGLTLGDLIDDPPDFLRIGSRIDFGSTG